MNPAKIRKHKILLFILLCLLLQYCRAQQSPADTAADERINFYVFTKDADAKVDIFGNTILWRARAKSLLSGKQLRVVIANDTRQVVNAITTILRTAGNARIGSLWFDSHGLYKQGYSSFHIGTDEYSYHNISDSAYTSTLRQLSPYCDDATHIGIGSCYSGATFYFPGNATVPCGRMNGDSLLIGIGRLFMTSTIYGSESWVMAKPGIFNDKFGFAGYPLGKRYRSRYWQPVWERLGQWNRYRHDTGIFEPVATVALNSSGQITLRSRHYQQLRKGQKAISKNLAKLE